MSPELLSGLAASALSLFLSYFPGLSPKFSALDPTNKRLAVGLLVVLIGVGGFLVGCYGLLDAPPLACTKADAWRLASSVLAALVANQSVYSISPKPEAKPE